MVDGHQALDFDLLSCSPFQAAGANILLLAIERFRIDRRWAGQRGTIMRTTVDHALIRGLVTAGPVMRRGASSV